MSYRFIGIIVTNNFQSGMICKTKVANVQNIQDMNNKNKNLY